MLLSLYCLSCQNLHLFQCCTIAHCLSNYRVCPYPEHSIPRQVKELGGLARPFLPSTLIVSGGGNEGKPNITLKQIKTLIIEQFNFDKLRKVIFHYKNTSLQKYLTISPSRA